MTLFLENEWAPEPAPAGTWTLRLTNLSEATLKDYTLSVTTITRIIPEHFIEGGCLLRRTANFHEFAPDEGVRLAPGATWTLRAEDLFRCPSIATMRPRRPGSARAVLFRGADWRPDPRFCRPRPAVPGACQRGG